MKKKSKTSAPAPESKIDPAFLPKARLLIKKIKAKLKQLNAGEGMKPAKKKPTPAKSKKATKAKASGR